MKAEELRIGNYVDRNGVMIIIAISDDKGVKFYDTINKNRTLWFKLNDNTKPIRLTDKWLKKLGANKVAVGGYFIVGATYWIIDGVVFYKNYGKFYLPVGERLDSPSHAIEFEYVHEFQNIFSFTETP